LESNKQKQLPKTIQKSITSHLLAKAPQGLAQPATMKIHVVVQGAFAFPYCADIFCFHEVKALKAQGFSLC